MDLIVPLAQMQCLAHSRLSVNICSLGLPQSLCFQQKKPTSPTLGGRGVAGIAYLSALADYPKFVPVPEYDSSPYSKLATEDRDRQCGEASLPPQSWFCGHGSPFPGLKPPPPWVRSLSLTSSTERVGASSEPQKAPHLLCILGMVLTEIPKHLETSRLCSADR